MNSDHAETKEQSAEHHDAAPASDAEFSEALEKILSKAEAMRIRHMRIYQKRDLAAVLFMLFCAVFGGAAFGWSFLVKQNLYKAFLALIGAIAAPFLFYLWAHRPVIAYRKSYKTKVVPAIARALGNLKYHPKRGVSEQFLNQSGIVPAHKDYRAEDCFVGRYKGVKVIMSEARLTDRKNPEELVFDGIFTLLEVPGERFKGRTVITNDKILAAALGERNGLEYRNTEDFHIFSNRPENLSDLAAEPLLKELWEISSTFGNVPVRAVFFGGKYLFITVPCAQDLFEPSHINVPIASHEDALRRKKELQLILSIIDVLELYKNG